MYCPLFSFLFPLACATILTNTNVHGQERTLTFELVFGDTFIKIDFYRIDSVKLILSKIELKLIRFMLRYIVVKVS